MGVEKSAAQFDLKLVRLVDDRKSGRHFGQAVDRFLELHEPEISGASAAFVSDEGRIFLGVADRRSLNNDPISQGSL